MSGHTPGPWRVSDAKPTKTRGIDILYGYSGVIAHVPVPPSYMDSRASADAYLIASSAEMLDVLLDLFVRDNGIETMLAGNPKSVSEFEQRVHAVIAKATS